MQMTDHAQPDTLIDWRTKSKMHDAIDGSAAELNTVRRISRTTTSKIFGQGFQGISTI